MVNGVVKMKQITRFQRYLGIFVPNEKYKTTEAWKRFIISSHQDIKQQLMLK